jgi:glycosidase
MDFRISRAARQHYGFDETLFGTRGDVVLANPAAARRFAMRMVLAGGSRPERPVHAGEIDAIGIIHEVQHRAASLSARKAGDRPFAEALRQLQRDPGTRQTDGTLAAFENAFPSPQVHEGMDPMEYLGGSTEGVPNREVDLEEMLLLWVANQNPAFMVYGELFDDTPLDGTAYDRIIAGFRAFSTRRADQGTGGEDLVERLLAPGRASPDSLSGQLRWILENWPEVVGEDLRSRLTLSLDILAEEETAARLAWERNAGDAGAGSDTAALHGLLGDGEAQRFSPDRDWMPSVVLMAKSTYVWLDQLSRSYGRPIWTLDGIPDEELDRLRDAGVTGLWLIGLWERSHASQQIKQLRGNPDAVASAYSLMDYRIADDIGGETGYGNLRDRAWQRGIRLASDMVPNHMGIDSRWVIEHPDWFLNRPDTPFPSYSFNGPNLSRDERVGIWIEDHYYDNSDAAVVFKRQDRWSGQERYVYHGNDGTSFPWNDTAQLDYLNPETREAVIQTILAVARRFPIIRFDAAMTLAKRHVERLWYPLPGQGGAIPSRAEYSMPQEEFDRLMPNEFWREVVDRVAQEAPDTLLLAEAFWMLEGYFVRTLGMHRVYNSAFMHMLRDEKNSEYRAVIKETVGFDPEILKRYVNFMNNPDERTAIDQFGDGDKYFGVATMLATLPGLPMLGHGQIEGFSEKYGMEFRRATLDEKPNPWLVARHEREIFPLLRQRWRFAEASDFRLYDFQTDGGVDENVFAYSNGWGETRSLIVYNNRYGEARGWVAGVGQGIGIPDDGNVWLILRDLRSGLEYLRNTHDLHARGLEIELHAYGCHAFLSIEEVADSQDREFARLAWRIGLAGVPDVRAALDDQRMEPLTAEVARFISPDALRKVAGAALARNAEQASQTLDEALRELVERLHAVSDQVPDGANPERVSEAETLLEERVRTLVERVRRARSGGGSEDDRALAAWLGTRRLRWATLLGWLLSDIVLMLAQAGQGDRAKAFDGWGVDRALGAAVRGLDLDDAQVWRAVELVRALLALGYGPGSLAATKATIPTAWFGDPYARSATGWNEYEGVQYVSREAYTELSEAVAARDALLGSAAAFGLAGRRIAAADAQGFRVSEKPVTKTQTAASSAAGTPDAEATGAETAATEQTAEEQPDQAPLIVDDRADELTDDERAEERAMEEEPA